MRTGLALAVVCLLLGCDGGGGGPVSEIVNFRVIGVGYVYGQQPVIIATDSTQPWKITATGTVMHLAGGSADHYIPLSRIEVREANLPTTWVSLSGGPELQNLAGEPKKQMQVEFRILVAADDAPGQYEGDVNLDWILQPPPDASGSVSVVLKLTYHTSHGDVRLKWIRSQGSDE